MDKYEYKVRSEEISKLIDKEKYADAVKIADTIDWRRVKSAAMLLKIAALYRISRRNEDSREMLMLAYERYPTNRSVVYSLCELSIELDDVVAAIEYYKRFAKLAPKDNGVYTLRYRILEAQEASLEERIEILEELKKKDYQEEWAYELAYLYHRVGLSTKCVEECDDIILWFGDGSYVMKAMELKAKHVPLTPMQQQNYEIMLGNAGRNYSNGNYDAGGYDTGEDYSGQNYDDQNYTAEGYGGQNYTDQNYNAEGYTDQNYADQNYSAEGYTDQNYADQNYSAEGYTDQNYADQNYTAEGYTDQNYADQNYSAEGYTDQNYNTEGYTDQNYAGQNYNPESYTDQNYADQNYNPEGYTDQNYADQNYDPEGYTDQNYAGQNYTAESYDGQNYNGQNYDTQGYAAVNYNEQGYEDGYAGEAYGGESYPDQNYGGEGYPGEQYADDPNEQYVQNNYVDDGYGNLSYVDDSYPDNGYTSEFYVEQTYDENGNLIDPGLYGDSDYPQDDSTQDDRYAGQTGTSREYRNGLRLVENTVPPAAASGDMSQYNTINLQKVVAESMKELFPDENEDVFAEDREKYNSGADLGGGIGDTRIFAGVKPAGAQTTGRVNIAQMVTGVSEKAPEPHTGAIKKVLVPGEDARTIKADSDIEELRDTTEQSVDDEHSRMEHNDENVYLEQNETPQPRTTGPMKLDDVLDQWERMKQDNAKKNQQEIKKRVLNQTGKIFADFDHSIKSGILGELEREEEQAQKSSQADSASRKANAVHKHKDGFLDADITSDIPQRPASEDDFDVEYVSDHKHPAKKGTAAGYSGQGGYAEQSYEEKAENGAGAHAGTVSAQNDAAHRSSAEDAGSYDAENTAYAEDGYRKGARAESSGKHTGKTYTENAGGHVEEPYSENADGNAEESYEESDGAYSGETYAKNTDGYVGEIDAENASEYAKETYADNTDEYVGEVHAENAGAYAGETYAENADEYAGEAYEESAGAYADKIDAENADEYAGEIDAENASAYAGEMYTEHVDKYAGETYDENADGYAEETYAENADGYAGEAYEEGDGAYAEETYAENADGYTGEVDAENASAYADETYAENTDRYAGEIDADNVDGYTGEIDVDNADEYAGEAYEENTDGYTGEIDAENASEYAGETYAENVVDGYTDETYAESDGVYPGETYAEHVSEYAGETYAENADGYGEEAYAESDGAYREAYAESDEEMYPQDADGYAEESYTADRGGYTEEIQIADAGEHTQELYTQNAGGSDGESYAQYTREIFVEGMEPSYEAERVQSGFSSGYADPPYEEDAYDDLEDAYSEDSYEPRRVERQQNYEYNERELDPEDAESIAEMAKEDALKTQEIKMNTADLSSLSEKIVATTKKEARGAKREEIRDFTPEEQTLFENFAVTRKIKKQIIHALENMTLAAYTGNVIITGDAGLDTVRMAKNLIKEYQASDESFSGKLAKITGEKINQRNIKDVFAKLNNGGIIIEKANGMTEEKLYELATNLNQDTCGIVVIMEDTKKEITKLLEKQAMIVDYFNIRIDLMEMDNNALVAYAKNYALALEYSIDELGTLALYTRIANMQSGNHVVTKDEVRDIIDEAIWKSKKSKIKNFVDVLFARRYDNEDMIVLKERDFM